MAKCIMIQGTASSVGKSLLVAALCRIFKQDGYSVAPFKSQNMALNSYITADGHEMGRAQVVQAEAAGILPSVLMNPVLLKPTTDKKAQVIVNGKVLSNMSAVRYHDYKPQLATLVKQSYEQLGAMHDIIVIEGAGSPAEINLRDKDIVNMGLAEMVDAPVLLVGDIDKGGVFAALAGTMLLLTDAEKARVKGVIINKFRGDISILEPGLDMLTDIIHRPVVGVVPYTKLQIEDEDSVTERFKNTVNKNAEIDIAVIRLPHISNFTDFNALENAPTVGLRYVSDVSTLGNPDCIIIPGSKNTIEDLLAIQNNGIAAQIVALSQKGVPICGICGGYQMLGQRIDDPYHTEGDRETIEGLGLLACNTVLEQQKVTTQSEATCQNGTGLFENLAGIRVSGYEIHMGRTTFDRQKGFEVPFGFANLDGTVFGSYLHGIFDNAEFSQAFINHLRAIKGLPPMVEAVQSYRAFKEQQYDLLASVVRAHLDMPYVYKILNGDVV
ncbi:MAG: cobyric acid synthase [Hyphomonadaceae bacterium]|nr:cobyric acid synthase [Clostridia bacterium]